MQNSVQEQETYTMPMAFWKPTERESQTLIQLGDSEVIQDLCSNPLA